MITWCFSLKRTSKISKCLSLILNNGISKCHWKTFKHILMIIREGRSNIKCSYNFMLDFHYTKKRIFRQRSIGDFVYCCIFKPHSLQNKHQYMSPVSLQSRRCWTQQTSELTSQHWFTVSPSPTGAAAEHLPRRATRINSDNKSHQSQRWTL